MTETGAPPHLRGRRGGHHGGTINKYMTSYLDREPPEPLDSRRPRNVKVLGFDIKITVLLDSASGEILTLTRCVGCAELADLVWLDVCKWHTALFRCVVTIALPPERTKAPRRD